MLRGSHWIAFVLLAAASLAAPQAGGAECASCVALEAADGATDGADRAGSPGSASTGSISSEAADTRWHSRLDIIPASRPPARDERPSPGVSTLPYHPPR